MSTQQKRCKRENSRMIYRPRMFFLGLINFGSGLPCTIKTKNHLLVIGQLTCWKKQLKRCVTLPGSPPIWHRGFSHSHAACRPKCLSYNTAYAPCRQNFSNANARHGPRPVLSTRLLGLHVAYVTGIAKLLEIRRKHVVKLFTCGSKSFVNSFCRYR